MIEFEIRYKTQSVGTKKGQTVYYAQPKTNQVMNHKAVVDHIVRETSLSAGDVSNALISLTNVVCEALKQGMRVDLADLGSLRLSVTSKMMDSPEQVTAKALNAPKIVFTPKQAMREEAAKVEVSIDHSRVSAANSKPSDPGTEDPGTGGDGSFDE